jgi:DNA anti-recombination protein RmuC
MADEQYVTRDQHRADTAQLRGELKEEIAGVRQDVAVLTKTVEHLGQTVTSGFADMRQAIGDLGTRLDRQIGDLGTRLEQTRDELGTRLEQTRDELGTRLEQTRDELGTRLEQTRDELGTRLDRQVGDLGTRLDRQEVTIQQEIRDVRTTNQRQLWVLIGVVIVTMVGGMIKIVFFS